jgi:two-component sensor histidine kinase
MVISDNGVGFPSGVSLETTDSLGLQLVRSLADQLNGKLQFSQDRGTEFQIQFRPLGNESRNAAAG